MYAPLRRKPPHNPTELHRLVTGLALAFFLCSAFSAAGAGRQTLRGHVPPGRALRTSVGRPDKDAPLRLAIGLPSRDPDGLREFLHQLYDPTSSNFRQYLTPQEFTARFGPTEEDYAVVMNFAATNGLAITATHPNRLILDVSGTVADIERAFQVTMRVYQHPNEARKFRAPDGEPSLDLEVRVLHISGLDDYWLPRPNHRLKDIDTAAARAVPFAGSGPAGSYRGNDFRAAYVPGTPLTGVGQSVGLLQFDGFYANDIATYASQAGIPNIPLVVVPINGGVPNPGGGNVEVALDIEMVMSMAPGLSTIYVYEAPNPSPWVDLLSQMANDNLSKQLSCSWGGGGPNPSAEVIFQQMAAQGQSFFNASGDSDAFTSSIMFPADSPNITQVGGTTLTTTGPGGAYISETAWNWGLVNGNYVGTSGGVSPSYSIPSYQVGINMSSNQGSMTMRNIPDVALTGDGIYVVYGSGSSGVVGGTSAAAPLWAGFMALVNQQAWVGSNPPVGFINPIIYNIGKTNPNYAAIFHDTTTGNNFSASSPTKYSAVAGYDLCTGWGTPSGSNIVNLLTPPVSKPLLVKSGFMLVAESCSLTNGATDPNETVSYSLALLNAGTADATNVVVTLVATNGVVSPSGAQAYGTVVAGGSAVAQTFSFTAAGTCGQTITPTFQVQSGSSNLGVVAVSLPLGSTIVTTASVTNATAISIPSSGSASPYPATIAVSGIIDPVSKVTVTLRGLTHSNPDDIDVLLVGPTGQKIVLMSDAGGGGNINNLTLTFDDSAATPLGDSTAITTGTWQPSNYGSGTDSFSSPAPSGPYGSTLGVFNGQNPNGTWALYIEDDRNPSSGSIAQGWSLTIETLHTACCDGTPPAANLAIGGTVTPAALNVGSNLTFTLSVTNLGPDPASNIMVSNPLPAGINFVSANTTQGSVTTNGGVVIGSLGGLLSGNKATVTINAIASTPGTRTNFAFVSSAANDAVTSNNTASVVLSVNSFPTISVLTNRTVNEDTSTGPIAFTIGDLETDASSLVLIPNSSNTNVVPVGNIVFGGTSSNRTVTVLPGTNAFGSSIIGVIVTDGLASGTSSFVLTVNPVNDAPQLSPIENRTIVELTTLTFTNSASDPETNTLTFSLGAGAPTNATIGSASGVFAWTPNEAQGPSTNIISVIVTDNGVPTRSATRGFLVIVLETNSAPGLGAISDRFIHAGAVIQFTNSASDPDLPANALTFSLQSGAPSGASIDATNGIFSWATSLVDAGTTNVVGIIVTDDGVPSLSATNSFTAVVLPPPLIQSIAVSNAVVTLTWSAIAGTSYQLQTNSSLEIPDWGDAGGSVTATGANASGADQIDNDVKYFRVRVLP